MGGGAERCDEPRFVPTERFDTRDLPPDDRLPTFRRLTKTLYDTWALGDPGDFDTQIVGHRVGSVIFNEARYNSPARFVRSSEHLSEDGRDYLVLQAMFAGDEQLVTSGRALRCVGGGVYLRDWGHEFHSRATPMHLTSMVIPRHLLRAGVQATESSPVLAWSQADPAGRQLLMLWAALRAELLRVDLAEAELLTTAFLGFLEGLLVGVAGERPLVELRAMQLFLNGRLRREVGVKDLCRNFSVSRSQVYRLFEPVGGVRKYITGVRLERCYTDLLAADPSQARVADIASSWGFVDASSFSRRFKARFEATPSEVLGASTGSNAQGQLHESACASAYCRRYVRWFEEAAGSNAVATFADGT